MKMTTYLSTLLFSFFLLFNAEARTCNCIVDGGDWGTASTWDCAGGPAAGDTVNIPVGITVNVDRVYVYSGSAMYINVDGTIHLEKPGSKLFFPCGSVVYFSETGSLTFGSGGGGSSKEIRICGDLMWDDDDGFVFGILAWGIPAPLSIDAYTFYISEQNNIPTLHLSLEDEAIADEIQIYKAVNSNDFELIESIEGKSDISFTDNNVATGTNYYKVNLIGKSGVQETITLSFEQENTAIFYPNPAQDILNLNIQDQRNFETLKIFNLTGELVYQSNELIDKINVSEWETGIYLIQIKHAENAITNRLVVQ